MVSERLVAIKDLLKLQRLLKKKIWSNIMMAEQDGSSTSINSYESPVINNPDSSLKDLKNNNTNPKCESATSKRLGNPATTYPKGSFGDVKSRCSHDNAFSEASSGVECLKTCEGQLSPSKSLYLQC
ncbi:hypothetical protein Syun_019682 [Stephania yunnanensis]|uniref:Uncharacterized protein n=1 Tax=Stephania yunnanensis TaxID=152371 RepID=A0AAP0NY72_9MAGN